LFAIKAFSSIILDCRRSRFEVAHMAFLGSWSSEVFASITGLTGIIIGLFVGKKH
jgi:hypothetical protein